MHMHGRSGSSSWRPWLLSLAMDLAASRLVASGAELSQQAARVAAVHPALRGASAAELCLLQVQPRPCCGACDDVRRQSVGLSSAVVPAYVHDSAGCRPS